MQYYTCCWHGFTLSFQVSLVWNPFIEAVSGIETMGFDCKKMTDEWPGKQQHDQVAKEPIVNKVCFCFPFSFLPFVCVVVVAVVAATVASPDTGSPPPGSSTAAVLIRPPPPVSSSPIEELDCCQAGTTGPVVLPKIFFNETLPLTCGFVLEADRLGNSGKSVLESLGGGFVLDDGVGRTPKDEGGAELPDHGVVRCA